MEPSKEAIAVRITRLNRQILGKVTLGSKAYTKKTIDRESLLDALTALYDECNDDPIKKTDELVRVFVDKYRSTLADLRRTRVCCSDFDILQNIGRGYFGEVHMVREKQTSDVYALKSIRKELARKRVSGAEDERDILAMANTPWIPKLQYAFQDNTNLYLVMELCSGGDLAGLLARRNNPLSERDAAFYVCEVAHALKALHTMGYVHRDVKPSNILLDRCGHVKLGDFGSSGRLSEGGACGGATPDYVAPELLAAARCAEHAACERYCAAAVTMAVSACDYWSLGVVAFELVTLKRPFSTTDEDSVAEILSNIQSYERSTSPEPPFPADFASDSWRDLVRGLLRVQPAKRYNYLDTTQHAALGHLHVRLVREQPPPWVPLLRGAEDAAFLQTDAAPPRAPPSAAPFRTRAPFNGQLPFVGYSYVAPEGSEDSSTGFNASHDCTAIDLTTFKSIEKLAAMRSREICSLQAKLAAAEAATSDVVEQARRESEGEAERQRARLQAEITALTLQNTRLERQIEVEKEERMALQRTNQELSTVATSRNNSNMRQAMADVSRAVTERDAARNQVEQLEGQMRTMSDELARARAASDAQRTQHLHYKDILEHVQRLRHRRYTEINVRAIDTIAKERALRRQTLSGNEADSRELTAKLANAEANIARETRSKEQLEKRVSQLDHELDTAHGQNKSLQLELDEVRRQLASMQEILNEKQITANATSEQLTNVQTQLAQEKVRVSTLQAQVAELERSIEESVRREASVEEQCARTEARLNERLQAAENRAANAVKEDRRHQEKVQSLEQLVHQLEREVTGLESRSCARCAQGEGQVEGQAEDRRDQRSDTESVADVQSAHASVLREQLERAETQLQARAEEIATLKQETRAANLAKWRKEREYNELSVQSKTTARELKRLEERLTSALEAKKSAEQKASTLESEMAVLKPLSERTGRELERAKTDLNKIRKEHEVLQAEVDRSRNDIRKLKSELQYSEKRRLHAEEQEELSARERAQLRDELHAARADNALLLQNNKTLQEACGMLEEQLTDLEKLADIHELKNGELESELLRMRGDLEQCRSKLVVAQKQAAEYNAAASLASQQHDEAREQASHAHCQQQLLKEKLECREARVSELESRVAELEAQVRGGSAALDGAARRLRALHEECAVLRTRAHHHHAEALQLHAALADTQEELSAVREAAEAATAWWRTRETKTDATLRQQAKLIDFLQAKIEEAGRKKCSLSNKLFGRSGRRNASSPPLRRVNRELREEVEKLRAKLAVNYSNYELNILPPTPRREWESKFNKPNGITNGMKSIDTPDGASEDSLLIVWNDDSRERMRAHCENGTLVLRSGERELRATLLSAEANNLPQNEANRAFTIKVEGGRGGSAAVVCSCVNSRVVWVARLAPAPAPAPAAAPAPAPAPRYAPTLLTATNAQPTAALYVAPNAIAIGCTDGLHSLRGAILLECEFESNGARALDGELTHVAATSGRAVIVRAGVLLQGGLLALGSALRRAELLQPSYTVDHVRLPDATPPHLLKVSNDSVVDGPCVAVACGRRVFILRFDASSSDFRIVRSVTVDRTPSDLLLTSKSIYIASDKPLKMNLTTACTLEMFAIEDMTVAAAAKNHSPPKAILLICMKPIELLLCYSECGVFVDENGKRTRNEDPKWSTAIHSWEFVNPFLYVIGDDKVTIIYLNEEAYRAPPCTCETTSLASSASECYLPEIFQLKMREPALLGVAPKGIIVRTTDEENYNVVLIEGINAFKSIGASVESLETISDTKGSSSDLAQSLTDTPQDVSHESVEPGTGFLADIRKRARQLRTKNRQVKSDEIIKEILTKEVTLKRPSMCRKSPATTSEFDSDETENDEKSEAKCAAEMCAEMFTRWHVFS